MNAAWHAWGIVCAPLLVLLLLRVVGFVGCVGDDPTLTPVSPSLLKFNMDAGVQKPTPADDRKIKEIVVSWSLMNLGSPWKPVPAPPAHIIPTDATDDFLDPMRDPGSEYTVTAAEVTKTDQVQCTCEVRQGVAGNDAADETVTVSSGVVGFTGGSVYIFSLMQKPATSPGAKHVFVLQKYTPT